MPAEEPSTASSADIPHLKSSRMLHRFLSACSVVLLHSEKHMERLQVPLIGKSVNIPSGYWGVFFPRHTSCSSAARPREA
jgi:hypothetical protein